MAGEEKISTDGGEIVVTVPLLARLDAILQAQAAGFSAIGAQLANKADKADVQRLEVRLDAHAKDISELKQKRHDAEVASAARSEDRATVLTRRQKFWGGFGVFALVASALFAPVVSHFINFR